MVPATERGRGGGEGGAEMGEGRLPQVEVVVPATEGRGGGEWGPLPQVGGGACDREGHGGGEGRLPQVGGGACDREGCGGGEGRLPQGLSNGVHCTRMHRNRTVYNYKVKQNLKTNYHYKNVMYRIHVPVYIYHPSPQNQSVK